MKSFRTAEINHLKKAFETNGYPRRVIRQTMHRRGKEPRNDQDEPEEKPKVLYLPYVRNTSEEIEREMQEVGGQGCCVIQWHTTANSIESEDTQGGHEEEGRCIRGTMYGV